MLGTEKWLKTGLGLESLITSVTPNGADNSGSSVRQQEPGESTVDPQAGVHVRQRGEGCGGDALDSCLGLGDELLNQGCEIRDNSVNSVDGGCVWSEEDGRSDQGDGATDQGDGGSVRSSNGVMDGEGEMLGGPEHLVVLVHGVSGEPECFSVLEQILENQLLEGEVVVLASSVNSGASSHDGIEVCGSRLGEEISQVIAERPGLKRISFMAHSIGGLFSRYAAGINYDVATGKIFGLEPWCFISIATPHLGCAVQGESQVPFIGWGLRAPMLDMVMKPIFDLFAAPITKMMYGKSGRDLFLEDGGASSDPVIVKLVYDIPGEGCFFSALSQFRIRVCYANAVGDALVGWANASIRKKEELPRKQCDDLEYMGVVHEPPLAVGCWEHEGYVQKALSTIKSLPAEGQITNPAVPLAAVKQALVSHILSRLQTLPWCRIDVAIKNTMMTHTNIIVARQSFDAVGIPIVEHIAHRFTELSRWILTIA